jgi:ketosteroid isomerase-like protein
MNGEAFRAEVRSLLARRPAQATGTREDAAARAATAVMQRFEAAYVAADVDAIVACFAPEIEWRLPTGRLLRGRGETAALLKEGFADPSSPRFSASTFRTLGDTVVQNYRVSVPRADGSTSELDGCDIYRVRDGLITHKDAYWKQLPPVVPAASPGLAVPLVVSCACDVARLSEMLNRLLASPLADAAAQGALHFELRMQPVAAMACACQAASTPAGPAAPPETNPVTMLLRGVITERDIKALPTDCRLVGTAARAVLTPLARDALRQRGIAIQPIKEA